MSVAIVIILLHWRQISKKEYEASELHGQGKTENRVRENKFGP